MNNQEIKHKNMSQSISTLNTRIAITKIIPLLLLTILALTSCDKTNIIPRSGKYVSHSGEFSDMIIVIADGKAQSFSFADPNPESSFIVTTTDVTTKGHYPNYTYKIDELIIKAKYIDEGSFAAYITGSVCINDNLTTSIISTTGNNTTFELIE